ncbi:transglutaminase family protein [Hydrotalea sandarakina]|jgi:regulator of sirC expression with transglutaminase-like and TPR domain|uniref:Transglutaminase superfamily protein n=1 Tax=Hydrotalea sandarakina TaxID=1004304 RepID=A0A2W7TR46_9BACT|nr:transglutaminase family protein [Hydrotalea sandarakina]PZX65582.1 transglutaminase superfamily protein [Hydrotalea sandarakina]
MQQTKEINALFSLIDDPDDEVYQTIAEKIVSFGKGIIPNLENLWENTPNAEVQEKIEMLIHRLHYNDLTNDFIEWNKNPYHDLLLGALLVAKFQYPDLHTTPVLQDIEKIRRNVWLELNSYLTPLEQANVLSSIIYNYYNLKGIEISYNHPDDFFLHKVIESKKGNTITNSIIYQVLCTQLEINAKIINIPRQMVIAFFHSDYDANSYKGHPQEKIHFYVDSLTGQAYSHADIENYFKKISVPPVASYFKPMSNQQIIQVLLQEVAKCFTLPSNQYKQAELLALCNLLDS